MPIVNFVIRKRDIILAERSEIYDSLWQNGEAQKADQRPFKAILTNQNHVLAKYLPEIKTTGHNLRPRAHGYVLPIKDDLNFMSMSWLSSTATEVLNWVAYKFVVNS